ncbi:hypothetical protein [Sulfurimonas sp.]|uniref:hypothetical protein n=1 Tax=Sulfurimonas sp. TaxID=2022749 RepID=UPI00356AAC1E
MDEEINCSLTIDEEAYKITISELIENNIEIDYSSDIDFTYLVTILTEKIDEDKRINLPFDDEINDEINDEKLLLVINTIKEIIEIYNVNLINSEEDEAVEDN